MSREATLIKFFGSRRAYRETLRMEAPLLRSLGLTQQEIADALGVPQQTVNRWLAGLGKPVAGELGKVDAFTHPGRYAFSQNGALVPRLLEGRYEEVAGEIEDGSIDLILTDPPYLVSKENISRNNQSALVRSFGKWDAIPLWQYRKSIKQWGSLIARHLKPGGSLYLFTGLPLLHDWRKALADAGLTFCNVVLWHHSNPAPQVRQTRWCPAFDFILFYAKGSPGTFHWLGQKNMHSVIQGPICQGLERTWHPTQKPQWLLRRLIRVSSRPGDTVLDPFAGSGSTGWAAVALGRSATLVEPNLKYTGLIRELIQEYESDGH